MQKILTVVLGNVTRYRTLRIALPCALISGLFILLRPFECSTRGLHSIADLWNSSLDFNNAFVDSVMFIVVAMALIVAGVCLIIFAIQKLYDVLHGVNKS